MPSKMLCNLNPVLFQYSIPTGEALQVISSIHRNGNRYPCSFLCIIHKAADLSW